jgi:hypothetical protein
MSLVRTDPIRPRLIRAARAIAIRGKSVEGIAYRNA